MNQYQENMLELLEVCKKLGKHANVNPFELAGVVLSKLHATSAKTFARVAVEKDPELCSIFEYKSHEWLEHNT